MARTQPGRPGSPRQAFFRRPARAACARESPRKAAWPRPSPSAGSEGSGRSHDVAVSSPTRAALPHQRPRGNGRSFGIAVTLVPWTTQGERPAPFRRRPLTNCCSPIAMRSPGASFRHRALCPTRHRQKTGRVWRPENLRRPRGLQGLVAHRSRAVSSISDPAVCYADTCAGPIYAGSGE